MRDSSLTCDERFVGLPPNMRSWLSRAAAACRAGDADTALELLRDGVRAFNDARLGIGTVFGSRDMDELCLEAGRLLLGPLDGPTGPVGRGRGLDVEPTPAKRAGKGKIAYLLTEIYATGGHSRVVEDLVAARPGAEHLVIATDILDRQTTADALGGLRAPCRIVKSAPGRPAQKLAELAAMLDRERPSQIIHLAHHFDVVATAAMQPRRFPAQLFYIHHADHQLAFGVFLPGVTHVDLHPRGAHVCTFDLGLRPSYLPMVCRTEPERSRSLPTLITASCGSFGKFSGTAPMTFEEMVAARLQAREGFHVHMGFLPGGVESSVRARCESAGIAPDRFVNIPFVDDLAQALATLACDLYIVSFPLGGGKAVIEAMSAGIGILCYGRPDLQLKSSIDIAYPEALVWRTPEEFRLVLARYDDAAREAHRDFARAYFRRHHAFPLMVGQWTSLLERRRSELAPPAIKPFRGSPLAGLDLPAP